MERRYHKLKETFTIRNASDINETYENFLIMIVIEINLEMI